MAALDLPYREREINGTLYRATILTLDDWAALTEHLAGLLGEPVASLLRGDAALPGGQALARSDIEVLIVGLVSRLTKRSIMDLVGHMARGLRGGEHLLTSQAQQTWWPRHMRDLAPVVGLFLEAQYADFFEGLGGSLPLRAASEADPSSPESD